jgi:CRP-like cAMP-binding protein
MRRRFLREGVWLSAPRRDVEGAETAGDEKMLTPLEERALLLSIRDILEPLTPEEWEGLARRAPDTHFGPGEVLRTPEERVEKLFLLKKGRVRVYAVDPEGREHTLAVAGGGSMLGEMAITGQRLSGVYVQVMVPSVVCSLTRKDLDQLVLRNPEVGSRVVRLLSERLRETETFLAGLMKRGVRSRLASLILRLAETEGISIDGGYEIPTPYTHERMATMIGSTRVPVTRALAKLKEAGIVEMKNRRIHLVDLDALKHAAAQDEKN